MTPLWRVSRASAEGVLAVKYRVVGQDGHSLGGPFYYIENGMGTKWKWLAKIFAFFGMCVGLMGIGTITQVNGITSAAKSFFYKDGAHTISLFGRDYSWAIVISAMQKGIARGIFSNEAGLGSAPIAAAAAKTNEPVRQGLVSMTGTFIDTIIICTMTGLSIVITNAYAQGFADVNVTIYAFTKGLPFSATVCSFIVLICLSFFAFTTILGWDYYSERCLEYLSQGNKTALISFRWLYILAVLVGPFLTVSAVWTIADIFNALMALPNLVAIFALSGVVVAETKLYFDRLGKGEIKE